MPETGRTRLRPWSEAQGVPLTAARLRRGALALDLADGQVVATASALVVDQGTSDGEAFVVRSSDVAHGMTTHTSTSTYFAFAKSVAASGGVDIVGYTEATIGLSFVARVTTGNTVKTTSAAAPFQLQAAKKSGTTVTAMGANENLMVVFDNNAARLVYDVEGDLYLNGSSVSDKLGGGVWLLNVASNAKSTQGVTLNQGGNDDEILALQSTDVAHGVTNQSDTATYAAFQKNDAAAGGLLLKTFTETIEALAIGPYVTTESTTKTSSGGAAMRIDAYKKNGTGLTAMSANANILAVSTNLVNKLILDVDGDLQVARKVYAGTDAGALQTAAGLMAGTGAPNNANGSDGDYYLRSDGGASTHLYFKSGGSWTGLV